MAITRFKNDAPMGLGAGADPELLPPMRVLCLAGDVMIGRGVDQIFAHPSSPELYEPCVSDAREYVAMAEEANGAIARPVDAAYVWGDARAQLDAAEVDARIVNLETSITADGAPWPGKGIHYRMHPDNVACITAARADVAVLANNHVLDWGRAGLVETLETLHRANVATVGAGRTRAEAEAPATVVMRRGRIVVSAHADAESGVPPDWEATADLPGVMRLRGEADDEAAAIGDRLARAVRPNDIAVVSLHWGPNWGYDVPPAHERFAHRLVDRGVDVVYGHSSHHPKPIEVYRGRLVLYGCGDLVNDYEGIRGYEAYRGELALLYLVELDDASGELRGLTMLPFRRKRMRLARASREDIAWMADNLARIGAPFGARIEAAGDRLVLAV